MKKSLVLLALVSLCFFVIGKANAQTDSTFKPYGKVSGQIFFDYSYQIGADTLGAGLTARGKGYYSATPKDMQSFDVRRIYLGYDYWFTANVSAGILLAHEPSVAPTLGAQAVTANNLLSDATNGFYLKGAYVRWKNALPMATVTVGQQPTPAFALSEQIWGYRSIEKTLFDFRGLEGSNDLGVSLKGSFDNDAAYGYTAMISNGTKQKTETNKFKKYYAELYGMFLDKHLVVEFVADADFTGATMSNDTSKSTTLKGLLAYQSDPITVGAEYGFQNVTVKNTPNAPAGGLSVFAHAAIMEKTLGAFARFDMFDPNANVTDKGFKENFITAGLDWQPQTNVHIEPNIWMDTYKDKSSANLERKADVVGRLTFFAKF